MTNVQGIGRPALVMVGLGIGTALATTPGIASADPLDMQISIDGTDLFPTAGNTAIAESGTNDIAIAIGNGSTAQAGDSLPGQFDFAFADGAGSYADVGIGNFDSGFAEGTNSSAFAGIGDFDSGFADGTNSSASVGGFEGSISNFLSNGDFASAFGANTSASAGIITSLTLNVTPSANDVAMDFDPFGSLGGDARAGDGNFDLASIFGDHSVADAGLIGNSDLAEIFGNGLTSLTATGGNFLTDILSGSPF
jgi:hypothetical protein